jgi:hypothetical protein
MKARFILLLLACLCLARTVHAQVQPQITGAGAPTNPCVNGGQQYLDTTNHTLYNCPANGSNWVNIALGNLQSPISAGSGAPANTACQGTQMYVDTTAGTLYVCKANVLTAVSGGGGGVSSVGLSVNGGSSSGIFAVTGSPVTTSGTLNVNETGSLGNIPYFNPANTLTSNASNLSIVTTVKPILNIGSSGLEGDLQLFSPTSGSIIFNTVASPGSQTVTWGSSSGTPAVTASAPLVIASATGNITAPTAVTSAASLTSGVIPMGQGGQALANSSPQLDDAVTTANTLTYAGTGGIVASAGKVQSSSDGTHAGAVQLVGNTTVPTLASNTGSILGPNSASFTSTALQLPTAYNSGSAGVAHIGAASSSISQLTSSAVVDGDFSGQLGVAHGGTNLATLTAHNFILGEGASNPGFLSCTAGQTVQGSATDPTCTATPTLGASGTLGSLTMGNATSGLLTIQPTTGAITSYTIGLPVAQPTSGNTFLSCTAANPAVCTWAAGGGNPTFDKTGTGLLNPTADATFTQPNTSVSGWTLAGTAPASVSTSTGTNATTLFNVNGVIGGGDSNATGTAGIGSSPTITAGAGGAGTGTNTVGGAGGSITFTAGNGGASAGTGINSNGGGISVTLGSAGTGGSGTAGKAGVIAVTGPTAGFDYYTQGSAVTTANTNVPANSIIEQAPTAVTAYVLTKPTAAPTNNNSAKITTTAGVETYSKMPQTVMLTSQYTNSTTSFTNVTGGNNLAFTLDASTTYQGTCVLYYQAASTGGLNIEFTGPASPTFVTYGLILPVSVSAFAGSGVATAYSTSLGSAVTTAATNFPAIVTFGISNGSTSGTLQLLAKSSAAVQLQIQTGSYCTIQ